MSTRQTHKLIAGIVASMQNELDAAGITATVESGWLTLSTPFAGGMIHGRAIPRCAMELLERNGDGQMGAAKIILTRDGSAVLATAELLTDEPESLPDRVSRAMADLSAAIAPNDPDPRPDATGDMPSPSTAKLEELCAEAGWPCHRRGDGRMAIALDVAGSAATAILGGDSVSVELASADVESEEIRQAVGVFLLQLGGVVRLVRPALCRAGSCPGDRTTLALQTYLGPTPTAIGLNHALAALSVACRIGQREVALLLSSESICNRYLSLRGWSAEVMASV